MRGFVVRGSWAVNIRKFLTGYRTLEGLVELGSMPPEVAVMLRRAMRDGLSVIVSGATHAGKTTLLGALLASCADTQRIVTVEETFELSVDGPDLVAMQGRQASLEGTGEITLRRLVKEALRMRPDRLVVGEVRDAAEDGEGSYEMYAQWLATIDDAQVVAMFEPLGEAAKARDIVTIMRITGGWRDSARGLG